LFFVGHYYNTEIRKSEINLSQCSPLQKKLKSPYLFDLQVAKHYAPAAAAPIHYDYDDGYYNQGQQYEYIPQYDQYNYGHYASPYAGHY